MQPRDLPLLLASRLAAPAVPEPFPLDRIRMQKAVFLLAQRGAQDWRPLYNYEPYDWGPYSRGLARDLGELVAHRQLAIEPARAGQYGRYVTTELGEQAAAESWQRLSAPEQTFIRAVRHYVTSKSFSHLLREVYADYPQYATNSKFTG